MIEVTGTPREPVLLENDDVLRPSDLVCLLDGLPSDAEHSKEDYSQDTVEVLNSRKGSDSKNVLVSGKGGYVKGSGKATPLGDFIFEKGKINCMVSWIISPLQCTSLHFISFQFIMFSTCGEVVLLACMSFAWLRILTTFISFTPSPLHCPEALDFNSIQHI